MKSSKLFVSVFTSVFILALLSFSGYSQDVKFPAPSPNQKITQAFGVSEITIDYSRPSVKGRTIMGDLVPYGKIWRTGANNSTQITFGDAVKVEGVDVPAGTYAIYTIPNANSWDVMLYSDLKLAGNTSEYKPENEVAKFTVTPTSTGKKVETFTINIEDIKPNSAKIEMVWENTSVAFNVTTEIDSKIMAGIDASMKSDKPAYFQAAAYYYENGKDMNKALEWVNKAIESNDKAFWMMMLKSRIQHKMGDMAGAQASAEKVVSLATDAKNDDYIKMGNAMISDIKDTK
jgi:hypothetical protein